MSGVGRKWRGGWESILGFVVWESVQGALKRGGGNKDMMRLFTLEKGGWCEYNYGVRGWCEYGAECRNNYAPRNSLLHFQMHLHLQNLLWSSLGPVMISAKSSRLYHKV